MEVEGLGLKEFGVSAVSCTRGVYKRRCIAEATFGSGEKFFRKTKKRMDRPRESG